jgi:hypothetical protein
MDVVFSDGPLLLRPPSHFLAGPTPRRAGVPSWRPEALAVLGRRGVEGDRRSGGEGTVTESEWLSAAHPDPMLVFLRSRGVSERKLRLFACACVRRVWDLVTDERSRRAVEAAEEQLGGPAGLAAASGAHAAAEELNRRAVEVRLTPLRLRSQAEALAAGAAAAVLQQSSVWGGATAAEVAAGGAATAAAVAAKYAARSRGLAGGPAAKKERRAQAALLADIAGNPFRRHALQTSWRTPTVVGLARSVYEERAFDRLPVLADALLDAGCADEELLGHLRGPGPHVRGCWAVDVILGRV